MKDLNQITIIGRLTRDAEKKDAGGAVVFNFSLACNGTKKGQDGSYEDEASFFDVKYFARGDGRIGDYLSKGSQVAISGSLKQERWEKDGEKKSKILIIASSLQLLGGKKDAVESETPIGDALAEIRPARRPTSDNFDDDIPF